MVPKDEIFERKSSSKLAVNVRLIGVAFVIFVFIITMRPQIFDKQIIAFQLILSIPFLLTSALSFSKLYYTQHSKQWDFLSWVTFLIGYTFLLNIVGIIVAFFISKWMAIIFFIVNWLLSLIYSYVDVYPDSKLPNKDVFKNAFFVLLQIMLGVLPALGII
jgi:hypothetical protein